jgi:hypothetical protein
MAREITVAPPVGPGSWSCADPVVFPALFPGDVLVRHSSRSWIAREIQRCQRMMTGDTLGARVNHCAVLSVDSAYVIEAIETGVSMTAVVDWLAAIDAGRGDWVLLLRCPGLPREIRGAIAECAAQFLGCSYDYVTILRLGALYHWWHPVHWLERFWLWAHPRTTGALTCSELVARAYGPFLSFPIAPSGRSWNATPDIVTPANIVDCGLWRIEGGTGAPVPGLAEV